jgi:two-component system, LytTR family, sensor kinase
MSHPITGRRRSILIYSLVWVVIAILHGTLSWYFQHFPLAIVIADALISNAIFAILGLLAWYPTRYIPFQKNTPIYSSVAHVVAGLLVIATWLLLSLGMLNALFPMETVYIEFLNKSMVWRGVLGGLIYLVLVLIYYLTSSAQKLQERIRQEEQLKNLVRETELNMLKSQINPHFLFNSLNSISSLTMSSPAEARDMIIRLSDFLRYSLKHRENEFVPLDQELGHMKDYLAIEKVRFGNKLSYDFKLDASCEKFPVPTMIFQPLFENAIRHSVYESTEPVNVHFECVQEADVMKTVVSNDFDPDIPSRGGTGVGLQNVKQRIELAYEGKGSVRWKGEDGEFTVSILFPRILAKR